MEYNEPTIDQEELTGHKRSLKKPTILICLSVLVLLCAATFFFTPLRHLQFSKQQDGRQLHKNSNPSVELPKTDSIPNHVCDTTCYKEIGETKTFDIIKNLKRWYNKKIDLKDKIPNHGFIISGLCIAEPIDHYLDLLHSLEAFNYKIENDHISIFKYSETKASASR